MKYFIPKGWHFSLPKWLRFAFKKKYSWCVTFNNSCKYDIGQDQRDWNKLVGISNHLNPRIESIRFVWRYNKDFDLFEIGVYKEINNKWEAKELTYVLNEAILTMKFNADTVELYGYDSRNLNHAIIKLDYKKNELSFKTNPYFGGNIPSPHCMTLKINEL